MIPCSVLMMLSSVEEFAVRMKRRTHKKVHELSCGVVVLQIPTAHIPTSLSHLSTIIQTQENDVHGGNLIEKHNSPMTLNTSFMTAS